MNREIKFRAWDNIIKKMFIPTMINADGDVRHTMADNETWLLKATKSFELMQFTGLKDKYGKEIYEGDIICKAYSSLNPSCIVVWHNERATYIGFNEPLCRVAPQLVQVIGNRYENPDF